MSDEVGRSIVKAAIANARGNAVREHLKNPDPERLRRQEEFFQACQRRAEALGIKRRRRK